MWFIKVGSRVTGPFNEDEMRTKRLCKELAPFHLVSRDSIRWESAAQLIKLLDGAQPEWKQPPPLIPPREINRDSREGMAPISTIQWYYVDASRNQLGPIGQEVLCDLLRSRQIRGQALVCKAGETQWGQARLQPELASAVPKISGKKYAIAAGAIASVVALAAIVMVLPFGSSKKSDGSTPHDAVNWSSSRSKGDLIISSIEDRTKFPHAVGLVVGTYRVPNLDGSLSKREESGTGSVFAITDDGFLLTNRHVAVMGQSEYMKGNLSRQFEEEANKYKEKYLDLKKNRDALATQLSKSDLDGVNAKLNQLATVYETLTKMVAVIQNKSTDIEPKLTVFLNGIPLDAKIIYVSQRFDFAILKVERTVPRPFFALLANNEIEDGTDLTILGYPGIANEARSDADKAMAKMTQTLEIDPVQQRQMMPQLLKPSRTQGIVNRCNEDAMHTWSIEHQVPTYPGNSGSPVFRKDGVVVGIHTAGVPLEGGGAKLNIAYSVAQFRKEIEEFVPSGVVWKTK
jgi:S1-C subfamily serine protease